MDHSLFLTEDEFLQYFNQPQFDLSSISPTQMAQQMIITYRYRPTLYQVFDPQHPKTVIKHPDKDLRPGLVDQIIDYFYTLLIKQRRQYLALFFASYFSFTHPSQLKWSGIDLWSTEYHLDQALTPLINNERSIWGLDYVLSRVNHCTNLPTISIQRNDHSRTLLRNLYYLELLQDTRVTNTCKADSPLWTTLLKVYNQLIIPDRLFAPSSLALLFRDTIHQINYQNFFYMLQQYQPKASIINPYVISWLLQTLAPSPGTLFTPVLSWSAYLLAFMYSPGWRHYIGVDVIDSVCDKSRGLFKWLQSQSVGQDKSIDIRCQPSESLLQDQAFLHRYRQQVDLVIVCPPYYRMELYQSKNQSVDCYPDYQQWLRDYWLATVKVCYQVLKPGGQFWLIINDYQTLHPKTYYPLIVDMNRPLAQYFQLVNIIRMGNRKSPMRRHVKDRSEKLFMWRRK